MPADAIEKLLAVCVCTYNSSHTLRYCLESIRRALPRNRLIVVDHMSVDGSAELARSFAAEIHFEDTSLGYARQLCFDLVKTRFLAFVDSDIEVTDAEFFQKSIWLLEESKIGAVVGMANGHRLPYGLPAGLLVLRKSDFRGKIIPSFIDARETYFIQSRLDQQGLKTIYVPDAMIHRSEFRRFKPEWEGANTRLLPGPPAKKLIFSAKVILLLSLNSRSLRNLLYVPVFLLKFLRGFSQPEKWRLLNRVDA